MKRVNYSRLYQAINNKDKLPRKLKKYVLGRKLNNRKLRSLLESVEIISTSKTMYEEPNIKPYLFCPFCGCVQTRSVEYMVEYPEHFEEFFCLRCNKKVAYIDNSPFTHALEYKEYGYEL